MTPMLCAYVQCNAVESTKRMVESSRRRGAGAQAEEGEKASEQQHKGEGGRCAALLAQTDVRVELRAPRFVIHNHSATLRCDHDVDPNLVYKVDYLRFGSKIFQYVRERNPPYLTYNVTGAKIDVETTTPSSIMLQYMDFSASGTYTCEVVLETPIYTKASRDHEITVIQPQRHRPKVVLTRHTLSGTDLLDATCTSAYAHPAPHLTWFINGKKVDESLTKPYGTTHRYHDNIPLASSKTRLMYPLEKMKLKPDESLELTCISTIPSYVGPNKQYADIKNHTLIVDVVQSQQPPPQPTQLPVRVTRTHASAAMRLDSAQLNALLLLMQLWWSVK